MHRPILLLSLVLFALVPLSFQQPAALPDSVTTLMANRAMRYHHLLFHNMRNKWNTLDAETQAQIKSYGWEPPRPAKDANGNAITDNNSGQDFLYMHRQMIGLVNKLLKKAGAKNVSGFTSIPSAGSSTYPMPAVFTAPTEQLTSLVKYYKGTTFYNYLKQQETLMKNTTWLKNMTLGELGAYIEWTSGVHQGLHFRFAGYSKLMRDNTAAVTPVINKEYDVTSYAWLVDIYASQVNPWFWKVHGWIDNRINDWQSAHGLKSIEWVGTWTGGNMATLPSDLDIPNEPEVRFLGEKNDKNEKNENNHGGMGHDMADMDITGEKKYNHPDLDPVTGMNISAMEAVGRILREKGVTCDYIGDLWDPEDEKEKRLNGWK